MNRSIRVLSFVLASALAAGCGGAAGIPRAVPPPAAPARASSVTQAELQAALRSDPQLRVSPDAAAAALPPAARAARASLLGWGGYPVVPSFLTAFSFALADPSMSPPGANVPCSLSPQHPYPVVLVHGTAETMEDNFGALAPILANNGYCVYAANYGSTSPDAIFQGLESIPQSAQQVAAFIGSVLAATGARQVDYVAHSQGGTLGEYYAKFLGGAPKIHAFVGITPSTHGTTFDGIVTLGQKIPGFGRFLGNVLSATCPSCIDQQQGSPLLQQLDAPPIAQAGPRYTVIATHTDEVITPARNAFIDEPGVTNEWVQNVCPFDLVEHANISYDLVTIRLVLNALGPATAQQPNCWLAFPFPA